MIAVTKAAARLSVDGGRPIARSTLSRYLVRHACALNPVRGLRETLVDYDVLRRHRAETLPVRGAGRAAPAARNISVKSAREAVALHDTVPLARYDAMGLVWLLDGRRAVALTADAAVIATPSGGRTTWRR